MGASQAKRLREATRRFGREDWNRLASTRMALSSLIYTRKKEAGLVSPIVAKLVSPNGPKTIQRYSTYLSYQQNEVTYGRSLK